MMSQFSVIPRKEKATNHKVAKRNILMPVHKHGKSHAFFNKSLQFFKNVKLHCKTFQNDIKETKLSTSKYEKYMKHMNI